MTEKTEYQGHWWLPDHETKVGGIATYDSDSGVRLELFSSLSNANLFSGDYRVDRIVGTTTEGELITLNDCVLAKQSVKNTPGGQETPTEYAAKQLLVGDHLTESEISFNRFRMTFPHLHQWVGQSGIKSEPNGASVKVLYESPSKIVAETDRSTIEFIISWSRSKSIGEFSISENTFLQIIPHNGRITLDRLGRDLNTWKNFVTLAMDNEMMPDQVTGYTEQGLIEGEHSIKIIGSRYDAETSTRYNHSNLNFSFADIQNDLSTVLSNWAAQSKKYGTSYGFYFSVVHQSPMQLENQYLVLMAAVEGFYREKLKGSVESSTGYPLQSVLDFIHSEYSEPINGLPWDIDAQKERLISRRHSIVHGAPQEDIEETTIYDQVLLLRALLEVALLIELGIPQEQVKERLNTKYSQRRPQTS